MELKSLPNIEETTEPIRSRRHTPPAHFIFKIESFSLLLDILSKTEVDKYESNTFEVGGYYWRLALYPNGNKKENGDGYISLYLVLAETNTISLGLEVNVIFKLFAYDHIQDNYLSLHDGRVRRFHALKTERGFPQLLQLETFKDSSNGYLINDCCTFGVEVLVIKQRKGESLSIVKEPLDSTCTWKLDNFSGLSQSNYFSTSYSVGGHEWKLSIYPRGDTRAKGLSLSIFMHLTDYSKFPSGWKLYAEYELCLKDQLNGNHFTKTYCKWFCSTATGWGASALMPLSTLKDASKGFIFNDSLIVEAKFVVIALPKNMS